MTVTLSELLLSVRMDKAVLCRIALGEDADVAISRTSRVCAHLVLAGSVCVGHDGGKTVSLDAGDFLCFTRGAEHRLQGARPDGGDRLALSRLQPADVPPRFAFGRSEPKGELLTCVFGLGVQAMRQAHSALPEMLLVRPGDAMFPSFVPPASIVASLDGPGGGSFGCNLIKLFHDQAIRRSMAPGGRGLDPVDLRFPAIARSLRLMDGKLAKDWTVASLAEAVGMSRSSFAAAFRQLVGTPPLAHLTRLRLEEAERLMRRDRLAVGEIAAMVGYSSQSAFTRAFSHHFGMTPRALRHGRQLRLL